MVGLILSAATVIAGFAAAVVKMIKPINDLNLNIVRLTSSIDRLTDNDKKQDERISNHGRQIDALCVRAENHEERIRAIEKQGCGR